MNDTKSTLCPICSASLSSNRYICSTCDKELPHRYGILSFGQVTKPTENATDRRAIERMAELTENRSIRHATTEVVEGRLDADQLLKEIYDTQIDAWRMFLPEYINGRCLDLHAGWGRRSLALAELVDSVYAVDSDLSKLRVLNTREDFESASRVVPIHSTKETLPLRNEAFDTVVADLTGQSARLTSDRVESLSTMVDDDGSLILLANGITRKLGISGMIGLDDSSLSISGDILRGNFNHCRRILHRLGYEEVKLFSLLPTIENLAFVYEFRNPWGHLKSMETALQRNDRYTKYAKLSLIASHLGLTYHFLPNFLIVGSRTSRESVQSYSQPVISTGRSRSVVFEYDNMLKSIQKIPNRRRHSLYNTREHNIIKEFLTKETQIRENLPSGKLIDSPFGAIRKEEVVEGQPLSEIIEASPKAMAKALSIGLDWLVEFQHPSKRERIIFSPEEYVSNIGIDSDDLDFSRLPNSVELFKTPVHGDFLPQNIYVEDEGVTTVIDWEYGALNGNPIVDAGLFIARVIAHDRTSVIEAMIELSNGQSRFARLGRDAVKQYCERVDIEVQPFLALVPIGYLHRVWIDQDINATMTYTNKETKRLNRVKQGWNTIDFPSKFI